MRSHWRARLQVGLVLVLFAGALGTLLFNLLTGIVLPQQEQHVRMQLQEASQRMALAAAHLAEQAPQTSTNQNAFHRHLAKIAHAVLQDFPEVEGGFYLANRDRFAGFAFPTGPTGQQPGVSRTDPPPLETPYLRLQARQCLDGKPGESIASVQDIGPSRVAMLTEPVGRERPARLATWVMYRITSPEHLAGRATRYAVSTALALGGIVLALYLSWHLGRRLKRQRQEQERLRDELRRAEHLAGLGKLLAGVAHEVRNPLAGIRSTAQLWQRLPETCTSASVNVLIGEVDRLNALVTRLLYFSRAEIAERRPVALNQVVSESLDLLQARAAEDAVTLERDLAPDLPLVAGSALALHQLVLNLLTNALQAMPAGGRLRCVTRHRPRAGRVDLRVIDTGPGIEEETRRHLFEPFFTTRPDGTGLGLALCREVALTHGGTIALEETSSIGSTFLVVLPEYREENRESVPAVSPSTGEKGLCNRL